MKLRVDQENNVAYLRLTDKPIEQTLELGHNVLVDIDINEDIVGIEFLDLQGFHIPSQVPLEFLAKPEEPGLRLWWGQLPEPPVHPYGRTDSVFQWSKSGHRSIAALPRGGGEEREVDALTFAA